jgi:putative hydrolase of the HAD superfamily
VGPAPLTTPPARSPSIVLWDFDGTLAERPGGWRGMLVEILDELEPGHGFSADRIAGGLTSGFPWHDWQRPHPELRDPAAWWVLVVDVMWRGMASVGVPEPLARAVAARVPVEYSRFDRWRLYPDTLAALETVRSAGWRSAILSNHCPELRAIVGGLGLGNAFERVFNSAETDWEKPNPEAFRIALSGLGNPEPAEVVMVGDSLRADIQGAARFGIRGILVRRDRPPDEPGAAGASTLAQAARLIVGQGAPLSVAVSVNDHQSHDASFRQVSPPSVVSRIPLARPVSRNAANPTTGVGYETDTGPGQSGVSCGGAQLEPPSEVR